MTDLIGKTIEIRVHKVYLTKGNRAVQQRAFFSNGTDVYSSDSDVVCILQHQGHINLSELEPDYPGVSVFFKVMRSRANFPIQKRNGIKSSKKEKFEGNAIKFDGMVILKDFGTEEELRRMALQMPNKFFDNGGNNMQMRRLLKVQ